MSLIRLNDPSLENLRLLCKGEHFVDDASGNLIKFPDNFRRRKIQNKVSNYGASAQVGDTQNRRIVGLLKELSLDHTLFYAE